jgi:hypothetical protein
VFDSYVHLSSLLKPKCMIYPLFIYFPLPKVFSHSSFSPTCVAHLLTLSLFVLSMCHIPLPLYYFLVHNACNAPPLSLFPSHMGPYSPVIFLYCASSLNNWVQSSLACTFHTLLTHSNYLSLLSCARTYP